jgi:hypothetical protein
VESIGEVLQAAGPQLRTRPRGEKAQSDLSLGLECPDHEDGDDPERERYAQPERGRADGSPISDPARILSIGAAITEIL